MTWSGRLWTNLAGLPGRQGTSVLGGVLKPCVFWQRELIVVETSELPKYGLRYRERR
jgi:hypothetical protein